MKDDSMLLLNDLKSTLYDKSIEKDTDKWQYEQAVSKCKKWCSLIKAIVGGSITVLSKQ